MLRFVLYHIRFQNWDASSNFLVELKKRANIWGVWRGVFGLSSRDCIVICPDTDSDQPFIAPDGTEVIKSVNLSSTARPQSSAPLTQSGLYVFRTFEIDREISVGNRSITISVKSRLTHPAVCGIDR